MPSIKMQKFWIMCSLLVISPYVTGAIFKGDILSIPILAGITSLKIAGGLGADVQAFGEDHHRFGRSVDTIEDALLQVSVNDADDCAKKLVCMINATPEESVTAEEKLVAEMFSIQDDIDLSKSTVEFDLAALVGRKGGLSQCMSIYARCPHDKKELGDAFRA